MERKAGGLKPYCQGVEDAEDGDDPVLTRPTAI